MLSETPPSKRAEEEDDEEESVQEEDDSDEQDDAADENSEEDENDSEDADDDEVPDVGEEAGMSSKQLTNPLYQGEEGDSDDDSSGSDVSDDSDDDSDDDVDNDDDKEDKKAFDEEDDLIAALKSAREKKVRDSPPDIKMKESATDISFHPETNVLAVANIQGEVSIFSYSNEENKAQRKLKLHKGCIRCAEFTMDGDRIITGGKDKTMKIIDTTTWKLLTGLAMTHDSPLYSLAPMEHGAVSGDENGTVKLWDFRTRKEVLRSKRFDEFVSSFHTNEDKHLIVASSGEGTIQSWDLRMNKPDIQSEVYSSELNALAVVREGTKLVVGSGEGILYLFNQGEYGYHSDQFPGHPDSINSLLAVTDTVVLSGCEDGAVRAFHLYPHRFIGQVGHHEGEMPVEKMDVSEAGDIVASIGHDQRVKFWNIAYLEKIDYDKKRKPVVQKQMGAKKRKNVETAAREDEHQLPSSGRVNKRDFFSGFE